MDMAAGISFLHRVSGCSFRKFLFITPRNVQNLNIVEDLLWSCPSAKRPRL